jgi:uncharacterized metal-binding protein
MTDQPETLQERLRWKEIIVQFDIMLAENAKMRKELLAAATTFEAYASIDLARGTLDGQIKAKANQRHANAARRAAQETGK